VHLEWSVLAFEDRLAIFDYIEADNPAAAIRMDDRVRQQIERLAQSSEQGRPGRIEGTRELIIGHTPYIAAYRIKNQTIIILRILHGARQWPEVLE
jgi:addiction module RelE/StbE family toxin